MFDQSFYDRETDNYPDYAHTALEETIELPTIDIAEPKKGFVFLDKLFLAHHSLLRIGIPILLLLIGPGGYIFWQTTHSTVPTSATASISPVPATENALIETTASQPPSPTNPPSVTAGGTMQVYIAGAVEHPGVYTLPTDARIYQLLQAAGGPDRDADLAQVNLASHISDGQEIDVPKIGGSIVSGAANAPTGSTTSTGNVSGNSSSPPIADSQASTNTTQSITESLPVNINTAGVTEMRQLLHVSQKTADNIINYRTEHGLYASITTLLNVVSKEIYNKIKGEITVS